MTNSAQPKLDKDPLPIIWRGEEAYEEARVGRVFNLRRPDRFPVAVLEARHVSDGTSLCFSCNNRANQQSLEESIWHVSAA